ncbi:hypothetical protein [Mucilaginibacter sp.]|uniref:hypothetical protein n=1 Tax=Mucilaginibacter sp. TaxID=1882438 RepID=UPI002624F63D|nr:hypothetical protein [Mucilaginibacter sp.]MDB5126544.1 hypothetical protein [Mucilaginibacter sp.]
MFDALQILLFGRQPFAKVSNKTLERIIRREFGNCANDVKQKLQEISATPNSKNRISAAILKLADNDINALDDLIKTSNNDFRDIVIKAEYPRCSNLDFVEIKRNGMKQIYFADWKEYSNWLNKI